MTVQLKIIWQFYAYPVHQKLSRFFGPRYIGDDFFLGPNLVSFNRAVVLCEISKVNFRVDTNYCQYVRRYLINKKISISVKQANKMIFITHRFRVSVVSDVRNFRITFALYSKKCVDFVLFISMSSHVCQKIRSTYFIP